MSGAKVLPEGDKMGDQIDKITNLTKPPLIISPTGAKVQNLDVTPSKNVNNASGENIISSSSNAYNISSTPVAANRTDVSSLLT